MLDGPDKFCRAYKGLALHITLITAFMHYDHSQGTRYMKLWDSIKQKMAKIKSKLSFKFLLRLRIWITHPCIYLILILLFSIHTMFLDLVLLLMNVVIISRSSEWSCLKTYHTWIYKFNRWRIHYGLMCICYIKCQKNLHYFALWQMQILSFYCLKLSE